MATQGSFPPELAEPGSPEERLLRDLDLDRLPRHVAIIMDGNGRWASARGLPRVAGHRAGVTAVRDTVEAAARLGLEVLTLYAFSRENRNRPPSEVHTLMALLREYLRKEAQTLVDNDIRLRVIGRMHELPRGVQRELRRVLRQTERNAGLVLNIALAYSGRAELVDACRSLIAEGVPTEEVDEDRIAQRLYTAGQPDPDLLIRTSGELRISNFLPWQIAYTEIFVTETLWPAFRRRHLFEALREFQGRERRFGALAPVEPTGPEPAAAGRGG